MAATRLDIIIEQGADFRLAMIWKSGTPAVPVDLSGYTARMQIRVTHASKTPLVSFATGGGGITLNADPGLIDARLAAAATALLPIISAVYDLELISLTGAVRRFVEGKANITPEVTRP